jgi:hypothetical protein
MSSSDIVEHRRESSTDTVSTVHRGSGSWRSVPSMAVRPRPRLRLIPDGRLPASDVAVVSDWIDLNRNAIVDYWDSKLSLTELLARLQ